MDHQGTGGGENFYFKSNSFHIIKLAYVQLLQCARSRSGPAYWDIFCWSNTLILPVMQYMVIRVI